MLSDHSINVVCIIQRVSTACPMGTTGHLRTSDHSMTFIAQPWSNHELPLNRSCINMDLKCIITICSWECILYLHSLKIMCSLG